MTVQNRVIASLLTHLTNKASSYLNPPLHLRDMSNGQDRYTTFLLLSICLCVCTRAQFYFMIYSYCFDSITYLQVALRHGSISLLLLYRIWYRFLSDLLPLGPVDTFRYSWLWYLFKCHFTLRVPLLQVLMEFC